MFNALLEFFIAGMMVAILVILVILWTTSWATFWMCNFTLLPLLIIGVSVGVKRAKRKFPHDNFRSPK